MSHKTDSRPVEYTKHRSAVIRLVLDLQQQLCPNVETTEYLVSPSLLNNWSAADWCACPSDKDLFPIENVAKSMLLYALPNPHRFLWNLSFAKILSRPAVQQRLYHLGMIIITSYVLHYASSRSLPLNCQIPIDRSF